MKRSWLIALVVVGACGEIAATTTLAPTTSTSTAVTTATSIDTDFPVEVEAAGAVVRVEERPQAIISLSPTATEMLFAIGAGSQVVAVDEFSTYPANAPSTNLSGISPNVEAMAAFRPDLVVIQFDANSLVGSLTALDIPVMVLPSALTLDGAFRQFELLGAVTGHVDEAAQVVAKMRTDIEQITASIPQRSEPLTYYHELEPSLYSVTSSTFIGSVYSILGLENIADPADADGFGYPQLSPEYIVAADPDLIFLADTKCCGQTTATVAARPGWSELTAVQSGRVVELDDDVASRWGPRVVDFLRIVAERVLSLEPVG